ncbi:MAG TPA: hypothetical protein DDZ68_12175 [Parvularcula sp.]|nr:hypothetical protein [Parvularcula sp.]HBS36736.1 hypothetical protein [Parvularcula sp.]
MIRALLVFPVLCASAAAQAPVPADPPGPPPAEDAGPGDAVVEAAARLRDAVKRIDPLAKFSEAGAEFAVNGVALLLVYDINADRMRVIAPVAESASLTLEETTRLMQANFDSALDARYALAKGYVWAVFLHPLSTLDGAEFGSGVAQTVNLVSTYGTSFNSGVHIYGGGDSLEEQQELVEELERKGEDI